MATPIASPPDERHVGRLAMRAATAHEASRLGVLVADALGTATFPLTNQGGLLLIRRLALGRIPRNATAQSVALEIERAVRTLASAAARFDSPAAGSADAVVVPGRVEALVRLARLHARGHHPSEWFWSRVVEGWKAEAGRSQNWIRILEAAHALPESAVAAGAIVGAALDAGKGREVLEAVSGVQAASWLRAAGFSRSLPDAAGRGPAAPIGFQAAVRLSGIGFRLRADDPATWLVTMLAVDERASRAANPGLPAEAWRWLDRLAASADPRRTGAADLKPGADSVDPDTAHRHAADGFESPFNSGAHHRSPDPTRPSREGEAAPDRALAPEPGLETPDRVTDGTGSAWAVSGRRLSPAALAGPVPEPQSKEPVAAGPAHQRAVWARDGAPAFGRTAFTACAGLIYLLPVMERLGMGSWLRDHPEQIESEFPVRLMLGIGKRAGLDPRDPLHMELATIAARAAVVEGTGRTPTPDWPDPVRVLLAQRPPSSVPGLPEDVWVMAIRRWCRRHARMGLVSVVRRHGKFLASRTHLDVFFDLSQIDLRIRRSGLDIDPGWISWLGRVVGFHYLGPDSNEV